MSDQVETEETQDEPIEGREAEEEVSEQETESEEDAETGEASGDSEKGEGEGQDEEGEQDTGYVEIKDPKVKARVGQITREKYEALRRAERLERELKEFKEKQQAPLQEIQAPDPDLAVDNPQEFTRQQQAYVDYVKQAEARRLQEEQQQQQSQAQQQQQLEERVTNYRDRAQKMGIKLDDLQQASSEIEKVGVHDDVVNFILDDPDGPAITAHLGNSLDDLIAVAEASPLKAVAHIERMRAKIAKKPKSSSAPKPPTKVSGARKSTSKVSSGWSIS